MAVLGDLIDHPAPGGSVAGRGAFPGSDGTRRFSFSVSRPRSRAVFFGFGIGVSFMCDNLAARRNHTNAVYEQQDCVWQRHLSMAHAARAVFADQK